MRVRRYVSSVAVLAMCTAALPALAHKERDIPSPIRPEILAAVKSALDGC